MHDNDYFPSLPSHLCKCLPPYRGQLPLRAARGRQRGFSRLYQLTLQVLARAAESMHGRCNEIHDVTIDQTQQRR